jgi:hypothetical protein
LEKIDEVAEKSPQQQLNFVLSGQSANHSSQYAPLLNYDL